MFEALQERAGFDLAVAPVGAIGKRLEGISCLFAATEPYQAERAIIASFGRKFAIWCGTQVGIPGGQRTRRIAIDEVCRVGNAVSGKVRICTLFAGRQ